MYVAARQIAEQIKWQNKLTNIMWMWSSIRRVVSDRVAILPPLRAVFGG